MTQQHTMEYTNLGRTGLQVSRVCLGTMTFAAQCDEPTSHAIMDVAADAGVTFVDTADVYPVAVGEHTAGATETIVGNWRQAQSLRARNEMPHADRRPASDEG